MSIEDIDEKLVEQQYDRKADRFFKKYRALMEILEKSPLAKVRGITTFDYYSLGTQLEQWDMVEAMFKGENAVGSVSDLGLMPRIAHDVITVNYGTSPMALVASVQPIDDELGNVYYKTVSAITTKGNKTANEAIVNVDTGMQEVPQGFASALIEDENVATGDGSTTDAIVSTTLENTPVRNQSVVISATVNGSVITGNDSDVAPSGATGSIVGVGILSGTITYATGAITVSFDTAPDVATAITCTYQVDMEAQTDITKIGAELTTKPIRAIPYALKGTIGLFKRFQLMKRFGSIAEDEMAMDLTNTLNAEMFGRMVKLLWSNIGGTVTWDAASPSGVSEVDHRRSLKFKLAQTESSIVAAAGRGTRSFYIAGRTVAEYFSELPGFKLLYDGASITGAHLYGTLDGVPVIRVPADATIMAATNCVVGYKGLSAFEAPAVYAPYMPLTVTSMLPMANPLVNQRAAAVWAGIDILVNEFLTGFAISNPNP